ncbi:MAG: AAA family ATPase [Acidobacteria bacterium]|nr:AAA family ATPase [Acidobacteriota bacterium]
MRMLRAHGPQVLFLSIESLSRALEIVAAAEAQLPGLQVIAVGRNADPQTLLEVMRSGIREFVSLPFQRTTVCDALARVKEILDRRPVHLDSTDLVFTFLPSKPGVGSTTIAVNAAVAVSRQPEQRSLLVDCDMNSGMVRFLLQIENNYSILDAAERAFQMDENIWPQLVSTVGGLDVLHSGRLNPESRVEPTHVRHILDFSRRNYKTIILDLSGNLEKFSIEAMHESKRVFLVVTPEVPSLHLAREKIAYLRSLDLGDHVAILLNRCQKRSLVSPAQVEELLGQPVLMTFGNDYQGVHKAMTAGKTVDPGSELGRQFAQLAQFMLDRKATAAPEKKRLVEYFSLLPQSVSLFAPGKKPAS